MTSCDRHRRVSTLYLSSWHRVTHIVVLAPCICYHDIVVLTPCICVNMTLCLLSWHRRVNTLFLCQHDIVWPTSSCKHIVSVIITSCDRHRRVNILYLCHHDIMWPTLSCIHLVSVSSWHHVTDIVVLAPCSVIMTPCDRHCSVSTLYLSSWYRVTDIVVLAPCICLHDIVWPTSSC